MSHRQELEARLKLFKRLNANPALIPYEIEICRRDVLHFINRWCLTYDPRAQMRTMPFVLYDFQEEAIRWIDDRYTKKEVGIIEKSRDMGVTWLFCGWTLHKWLFSSGFTARVGSRKEALVDNDTMDSIFGKVRFMMGTLPWFLRPQKKITSKHLTMINPDNGNEIVGESANVGFGRGGRSSINFIDEFAHIQHSEAIWSAVSDNSDCIIPVSTPNGKGNQFAWLKYESNVPCLTLHWTKHPLKDQAWYDKRKSTMKPWQVAQELDLSYETSKAGRIYKRFDRRFHVAQSVIECDTSLPQFCTWDFGISDPTAIAWGQITVEGKVQIWNYYELAGQDIDFHAPISKGLMPAYEVLLAEDERQYIKRCLRKVPMKHVKRDDYGDHSGVARTANAKRSCRDAMRDHGLILKSTGKNQFDWRHLCLDNLLKVRHNPETNGFFSAFEISPDCQQLIDAMFNYEYDTVGGEVSDEKIKPLHNWASHGVTALEYLAINRFPVESNKGFRALSTARIR